jgi:hypothetical protein
LKAEAGDKVRIKHGPHAGERAFVKSVNGETLWLQLQDSDRIVSLSADGVTNYSLAARKAWVTGPDRAVGRRKGSKVTDRVTVAFRIDRDLWERFLELETAGKIEDRNALINEWFREKLLAEDGRCPRK